MDAQNIAIVKFLIKETPIGHLKGTLDNLKSILGVDVLESEEIRKEIIAYEEEHLKQLSVDEDKILISSITKDSDGYYYDQNKNLKVLATPMNENFEKIEKCSSDNSELKSALYAKLDDYKKKNYKAGITSINGK